MPEDNVFGGAGLVSYLSDFSCLCSCRLDKQLLCFLLEARGDPLESWTSYRRRRGRHSSLGIICLSILRVFGLVPDRVSEMIETELGGMKQWELLQFKGNELIVSFGLLLKLH